MKADIAIISNNNSLLNGSTMNKRFSSANKLDTTLELKCKVIFSTRNDV
jgi:hypothetical protein